jgi:hypothetical protein
MSAESTEIKREYLATTGDKDVGKATVSYPCVPWSSAMTQGRPDLVFEEFLSIAY